MRIGETLSETLFEFALCLTEVAGDFRQTRSTKKNNNKQNDDPDFRSVEHKPTLASPPKNALSKYP